MTKQPVTMMDETYVTSTQLIERYRITQMTLWRWERDSGLGFPAHVRFGRRKYWKLSDLELWEATKKMGDDEGAKVIPLRKGMAKTKNRIDEPKSPSKSEDRAGDEKLSEWDPKTWMFAFDEQVFNRMKETSWLSYASRVVCFLDRDDARINQIAECALKLRGPGRYWAGRPGMVSFRAEGTQECLSYQAPKYSHDIQAIVEVFHARYPEAHVNSTYIHSLFQVEIVCSDTGSTLVSAEACTFNQAFISAMILMKEKFDEDAA